MNKGKEYYVSVDSHIRWDEARVEIKGDTVWLFMNRAAIKLTRAQADQLSDALNNPAICEVS